MIDKTKKRSRRAAKSRYAIRAQRKVRLCIHRTPNHIYAQLISAEADQVLAQASTLDKEVQIKGHGGNVSAAEVVGEMVAKRAIEKGIKEVAFDRSGFKYHGRVKALAEAARKAGLEF